MNKSLNDLILEWMNKANEKEYTDAEIQYIYKNILLDLRERVPELVEMIKKQIVNHIFEIREDWRNDGQFQVLPTVDYIINSLT